jgi:hypothetical protein
MVVKRRFYVCFPAAGGKFWDYCISRFENFNFFSQKTIDGSSIVRSAVEEKEETL